MVLHINFNNFKIFAYISLNILIYRHIFQIYIFLENIKKNLELPKKMYYVY